MSKEETPPAGGLLSKMVRFVRNPTVQWTELDSLTEDRESQYSKQMLKEMIERKRRNDFVRRREFDQLRKLRQREVLQGHRTEDASNRPSFFKAAWTSPDERAVTLKKIDEIEAQMSQQWWKSNSRATRLAKPCRSPCPLAQHSPHRGRTPRRPMPEHLRPRRPVTFGQPVGAASAAAPDGPSPVAPFVCQRQHGGRPLWRCGRCAASGTRGTPFVQPPLCQAGLPCGCPAGEIRARTRS